MLGNKGLLCRKICFVLLLVALLCWIPAVGAKRPGWQRQEVDWRMTGGSSIKAVDYPAEKPLPTLNKRTGRRPAVLRKKILPAKAALRLAPLTQQTTAPIIAIVIDSPPIDGFIPWVAVAVTDERFDEEEMRFDAVPTNSIIGNYLTSNPEADYAIGIFDTGASAHIMSYAAADQAGLSGPYLTSNMVEVSGVTGSVSAWVSYPLGIFIDGLGAIEPNGLLHDTSGMVGETNVSIAVGDDIESPNLPTAIGSPLSVYFAADFRNDRQITVTRNSEEFTSPDIFFYEYSDPCSPTYPNLIPLELRPLGGVDVEYVPDIDPFTFEFFPISPSVIMGNLSQSIFFVHSVDLYEGNKSAIDKNRFMLDTGAQVTVVGSRVAARLGLKPADPDFEVEIQGVTGDTIIAPGFYIDSIEIPALGEWLTFTNIPVILLDVASPEGGTVDGVIGMNLFVELNFILRGGGLFGQDDPSIEFEPIPYLIADIAPQGGDGKVDFLDLAELVSHWLETSISPNWNPQCDMAPQPIPDEKVDFLDFAMLAEHWFEGVEP
jgi:predicted aspartyl protease